MRGNLRKQAPLWVVTSYFNPSKYRRRYQNFQVFRRFLDAPLLVVELQRDGEFELQPEDADIVLQLTGEDRIWQKERLLNLGIQYLPDHVDYVAWVDCDVLFEKRNWVEHAVCRLSNGQDFVQLFETLFHLPKTLDVSRVRDPAHLRSTATKVEMSFCAWLAQEGYSEERFKYERSEVYATVDDNHQPPAAIAPGISWAARRSAISKIGLYDANIIGSGDQAVAFAVAGLARELDTALMDVVVNGTAVPWRTEAQTAHYLKWASAFQTETSRKHTFLAQDVYHLWHGELTNRDYDQRFRHLVAQNFDPVKDIALAENGTWHWTEPDGDLARAVASYFDSRNEDG